MALPATTVFEVRPGSGSDTLNGGGFITGSSGTDWSQQATAQVAFDGTVISAHTAGVTNVIILTGYTPQNSDVGNIWQCTGGTGFIAGFYQIVSISIGGLTWTLDRNATSGVASGATGGMGGALATIATAEPQLTAGMTAWIKSGTTQTLTTAITLSNSGDSTSGPITWQGYHTSRGDHDGTRPLITTSTNSIDLLKGGSIVQSFRSFDNINWSSTAGTPGNGITPGATQNMRLWSISNCKISGVKNGIISDNVTYSCIRQLFVTNVEISSPTANGIVVTDSTIINGCYIHGCTGYGVEVLGFTGLSPGTTFALPVSLQSTVIYANTVGGVYIQAAGGSSNLLGFLLDIDHCAIVSNTNDGVKLAVASGNLSVMSIQNSIIYGNSGYGVEITNSAATILVNRNNAYGSNTSGARNNLAVGTGDVSLTADPHTNAAGSDFSLNATAGGGAACKAVGFPGTIAGCASAGSADIGAQQSAGGAGTTTNIFSHPRKIITLSRPPTVRNRTLPVAITTNFPLLVTRRQTILRNNTFARRPSPVIPAAPVTVPLVLPARRRSYLGYVPIRRNNPGVSLFGSAIILRSPIRQITRQNSIRRNAGSALFSSVTQIQTVLVTSPRKVR